MRDSTKTLCGYVKWVNPRRDPSTIMCVEELDYRGGHIIVFDGGDHQISPGDYFEMDRETRKFTLQRRECKGWDSSEFEALDHIPHPRKTFPFYMSEDFAYEIIRCWWIARSECDRGDFDECFPGLAEFIRDKFPHLYKDYGKLISVKEQT